MCFRILQGIGEYCAVVYGFGMRARSHVDPDHFFLLGPLFRFQLDVYDIAYLLASPNFSTFWEPS